MTSFFKTTYCIQNNSYRLKKKPASPTITTTIKTATTPPAIAPVLVSSSPVLFTIKTNIASFCYQLIIVIFNVYAVEIPLQKYYKRKFQNTVKCLDCV